MIDLVIVGGGPAGVPDTLFIVYENCIENAVKLC